MAAITSHLMKPLVTQLQHNYPDISFVESDCFQWSFDKATIQYSLASPEAPIYLLHETAHALLRHTRYSTDVELIAIERDAWDYARHTLAPHYAIKISDDIVQDALDTYRDWLHARSTCPTCGSAGMQIAPSAYHCIGCLSTWEVNEARQCGLRRYLKK